MTALTRRKALATIGAASLGFGGCLARESHSGNLGQVDGAWPMDGSDPGHTRQVSDGPPDPRGVRATELADVRAAGSPSVADGRLYVPVDRRRDRGASSSRSIPMELVAGRSTSPVTAWSRWQWMTATCTRLRGTPSMRSIGTGRRDGPTSSPAGGLPTLQWLATWCSFGRRVASRRFPERTEPKRGDAPRTVRTSRRHARGYPPRG
jgi:hypothetical protein